MRCSSVFNSALLLVLLLTSCSRQEGIPESDPAEALGSTELMARTLSEAYNRIDSTKATYLVNRKRLEYFRELTKSQDLATRIRAVSMYCYELINVGDSDRAIVELEAFRQSIRDYNATEETLLKLDKLLAVSWLRLGEQENCVSNRSHESCILPISGEGIYRFTKGPEKAIEICLSILNEYPDDAETIWLLNFAHMTLGTYPDGVPPKWRVPESIFDSDYSLERFTDVSKQAGITGTGLAGGCAVDDFNNDGLLDVIASSWSLDDGLVYYVNMGSGNFEDHSSRMQLDGITSGLNLIHADYDNDGDLDLFVLRGAWLFDDGTLPNSLIRNNGDGTFSDVTKDANLLTFAPTQTAVWADFNLDGWLDLFVGTESSRKATFSCELHLNNGDGTFRNVIQDIGVEVTGFAKGTTTGDFNNDRWPDIYISYYGAPNKLLISNGAPNGIPSFTEYAERAGVAEPLVSFPVWTWDFNNDGLHDIFVSGYGSTGLAPARDFVLNAGGQNLGGQPRLYINQGDLTFKEVSTEYGLTENIYTMGCNYGDLDNDGFQDMYLGTGDPEFSSVVPNKMFRNNGGQGLQDVTTAGGFGHIQKGHGVGFGDFDNDGDQDIFQVLGGAYEGDIFENILFKNPGTPDHAWVTLLLKGTQSNKSAIGARVRITVETPRGERTFHRTVSGGGSFGGSSLQLETGLGDATAIKSVEIDWPYKNSETATYTKIPLRKKVIITEGNTEIEVIQQSPFTIGGV